MTYNALQLMKDATVSVLEDVEDIKEEADGGDIFDIFFDLILTGTLQKKLL